MYLRNWSDNGKTETVRTSTVLDAGLVEAGLKATGLRIRRQLVDSALRDLLRHQQQRKLPSLSGKVEWEGDLQDVLGNRIDR